MKRLRKILACVLMCVVCLTMLSGCKSIFDSFSFVLDFEKFGDFFGSTDSVGGLSWPQKGVFSEIPQFNSGVITHHLDDGEEGILCITSAIYADVISYISTLEAAGFDEESDVIIGEKNVIFTARKGTLSLRLTYTISDKKMDITVSY
ncbi:MAG: hypothetical protein E7315_04330 [Clostridiales bacterium]|nr:hypothetical protein [Clostridiales bacterium]